MGKGIDMEITSFIRAHQMRALLEARAIVELVDTLDILIAEAESAGVGDAIAEHSAQSWRRRREALIAEHQALVGELVDA